MYEPEYFYLYEIRIGQIVFDESDSVTIFGSIPDELNYSKSIRWDFLCNFSFLIDILLFADIEKNGELIINILSEKLSNNFEIPSIIDLENIFNQEIIFSNLVYKVYYPKEKNQHGEWITSNENFYIIDSVEPKELFFNRQSVNNQFKKHFSSFENKNS